MKVRMLSCTKKPLDTICHAVSIMMDKHPTIKVYQMNREAKEKMLGEILKTRLRGALEFATFEFYLQDVPRYFTHQLVRHRTMHFSQQSLRFFDASESTYEKVSSKNMRFQASVEESFRAYQFMVKTGIPPEEARGILPMATHTQIMFGCTYRALLDLAEVRMCEQSQSLWKEAILGMKKEVAKVDKFLASQMVVACKRSGRCDFESIYDRKCKMNPNNKGEKSHGSGKKETVKKRKYAKSKKKSKEQDCKI